MVHLMLIYWELSARIRTACVERELNNVEPNIRSRSQNNERTDISGDGQPGERRR